MFSGLSRSKTGLDERAKRVRRDRRWAQIGVKLPAQGEARLQRRLIAEVS